MVKQRAADGETERRILDAAHAVFLRHGTAGARMQDIAREARVNQALLHYYFRSKDQLSNAVFRRAAAGLFPQVLAVLVAASPLDVKVRKVIELEIDRLTQTPYLPGYIISELHHHPQRLVELLSAAAGTSPQAIGPKVLTVLRRQIDEAVAAGTMRPIAAEQFLVNLLALCIFPFAAAPMMRAVLGLDKARFDRFMRQRRRQLPDFFLKALRP
jgi:TetR/AcrR family transcriptional regulator